MRRAAGFIVFMLVVFVLVAAGIVWLLSTLFGSSWLTAVLAIVLLLILARVVGGVVRATRLAMTPMGDLIEAAARIEAGELGTTVSERGPREVRTLARAFNAMSGRLAESDAERRALLADVSHELRTPLTVIQGNVEGMLDGLYPADRAHLERVLAETHQMERLIDDLRTLSLADAGALVLHRESTDLGGLAAEVVAGFAPQAEAAGVVLTVEEPSEAGELEVDPLRIRQVVGNLVSNALRHTPSGGRVTVRVARDGSDATLTVADSGEGMDADAAAHAFDRFWRSADSTGAGLGLAIVRDLVTAHGGSVELHSVPGEGTRVVCRLPG
jgi:two-component system sensor histidine kinase BaeS